ncbi:MAG: cell envelope biogenesis protein TolA, partial [Rhodobacteraceae bacterium]|nr:cell envelope biogenesis protein TolA [Paracoccaceae bacterium]
GSRPAPAETRSDTATASSEAAAEDAAAADAIAAALAEATAEAPAETGGNGGRNAPAGPPLNAGEIGDISSAIANKWNLGAVSTDVMSTVIVVRVEFDPSGKPVDIRKIEEDAPSADAARVAFDAARRAIQRAYMDSGIPLPPDKYETWKVLEFVFDANGMRLR